MITLNRDDIVAIFPPPKSGIRRDNWLAYCAAILSPEGSSLFERFGITTPLRMQHLLATWAAETALTVVWESGAYSAGGIVRTFGVGKHSAAIGPKEAERIAALPVDERTRVLFERVYGFGNPTKARDLGNAEPGDGWRFRGLGLNQITGRAKHVEYAREIGCSLDDLCRPINCIHAALIEWDEKDCNAWADRDDAVSIRKLINGGSLRVPASRINGLPDALDALARAKRVITDDDTSDETVTTSAPAPASMAQSTEAQAAVMVGGGGTVQLYTELSQAAAMTASTGKPSLIAFVLHLAAQPGFWIAAGTVAASAYWWLKRRAKLYTHGV